MKIFKFIPELGCFVLAPAYKRKAKALGMGGWEAFAWIGRFLDGDNDMGEHWLDNWDHRARLKKRAEALGYDEGELLIVVPRRFVDGRDGPVHSDAERKRFWTDLMTSLDLSAETIAAEARRQHRKRRMIDRLEKKWAKRKQVELSPTILAISEPFRKLREKNARIK